MIRNPETIVIEDGAHALGSNYSNGQKVGSCAWSHMTVFSFHPNKNITTGEGGMVTTNQEDLAFLLRRYRNNGLCKPMVEIQPWYYEVQEISGNFNVTEMQGALGLSQLKRLDKFVQKRRQLVTLYRKKLKNQPNIKLFSPKYDTQTAYHLFVIQINFAAYRKTRSEVMLKLKDKGIGTQVHYIPLYKHPVVQQGNEDISPYFPKMETYYSQALSLPLYYDLSEEEVVYVCQSLLKILA
jgi:dTDP-4-amino-4,6-dideoxygalactose transaminase